MADEYPYSSRDVVRPCYTGGEPGSFHHTILTSAAQMLTAQHKWWRWLGEESLSGGKIGLHEGGGTFPCGQRRPSQHSMMRWIGFDFDQIGLEHMVARDHRHAQLRPDERAEHAAPAPSPRTRCCGSRPGTRASTSVNVTWRIGGPTGAVIATGNSRNLDLEPLNLPAGHGRARRGP